MAVLGITHPTKAAQTKAINSITGSLAFVAAAQIALLAIEEPETERCVLLPIKNNLGRPAAGLGYRTAQIPITGGIIASHIVWDAAPVTMTADEAVRTQESSHVALREAKDFLREELAEGPRQSTELKKAAAAAGLSWGTVRRAQEALRIKPRKSGLTDGWQWSLPAGVE